jgi:hypothetical protein
MDRGIKKRHVSSTIEIFMKSFLGYMDNDKPDPVDPARVTPADLVRFELRSRPGEYLTTEMICERTGLTPIQVNGAIYTWTKQRNIGRRITNPRVGKNSGQAYKWNAADGGQGDQATGGQGDQAAGSSTDQGGDGRAIRNRGGDAPTGGGS